METKNNQKKDLIKGNPTRILTFRLSKKFYDSRAVKEAVNAFRGVGNGKILEGKDDLEVIFQPREDVKNLREELCNYALGLMKNKYSE
jgi:hypothetical protein